jgi:peptidoglycan/xylan/chitin deacetylase (PgdA/CDA1 family)
VGISRRGLLGGAGAFAGGVAATAAIEAAEKSYDAQHPLPFYTGYAASIHEDRRTRPARSHAAVRWSVDTTKQLAALTFDDGPAPNWTPEVLDVLDQHQAPATFFMVGERVHKNAALLAGRLDRHEVANHSWDHRDLARRDFADIHQDLTRTHEAIVAATGKTPTLLRPPYGHIGGSTLLAAAELGYDLALWSLQMLESDFGKNPSGLTEYIVGATHPGAIILAHDTGPDDRLVAIRQLPQMIDGIRARGFQLVTVSEMVRAASSPPTPTDAPDGPTASLVVAQPPPR